MKFTDKKYKVLIFGAGKMGKKHLSLMGSHPDIEKIGLYDPSDDIVTPERVERIKEKELEKRLSDFDFAIVACTTSKHFEVTCMLLKKGIPCMVEKPLTVNSSEHKFINLASRDSDTPVSVGFIERFNPALLSAKKILLSHRWDQVKFTRMNPSSARLSFDSVVSDLMIHDIDLAVNIFGERCVKINKINAASLNGNNVDYVFTDYTGTSGSQIQLCCSRFPGPSVRQIEAFGPDGGLLIDLLRKRYYFTSRTQEIDELGCSNAHHANPLLDQFQSFLRFTQGDGDEQIATAYETIDVQLLSEKIDVYAREYLNHTLATLNG